MKITLETVRHVLQDTLGFNSFTASFITRIEEDSSHSSAGITKDGLLVYNPQFVEEYVNCREDLFCLIFHELLHPLFGHFIHGCGRLENIAADAIINAFISRVYAEASNRGCLFRTVYEDNGLVGLLRPESQMESSHYERVYQTLYDNHHVRSKITTGELIQTLQILVPKNQTETVFLLGSHFSENSSDSNTGISQENLCQIAEDIQRSMQALQAKGAGYSSGLVDLVKEALRSKLSIKRELLQGYTTQQKVDRFKQICQKQRITTTPIPLHPSKRDLVLLASGICPALYRNHIPHHHIHHRGIAVYLDVSGSVEEYLPKILGVLDHFHQEIITIFLFSNQVVEMQFQEVRKGRLSTTHGTDFDCIAESILENKFDKAVIITDGVASMKEELQGQLIQQKLQTLSILFSSQDSCDTFAAFGDVVYLDQVCS